MPTTHELHAQQWRPFHGGVREFPLDGKSEIDRQGNALWQEIKRRRKHLAAVEQAARDAVQAVQVAHDAYVAEVERAAASGEISSIDAQLLAKRNAAEAEASPEVQNPRKHAAQALVDAAEHAYLEFIKAHGGELVEEIKPEAERVAAEYLKVQEECEAKLRPLRERHAQIRDAVTLFIGQNPGFSPSDLPDPQQYHKPPLPEAL